MEAAADALNQTLAGEEAEAAREASEVGGPSAVPFETLAEEIGVSADAVTVTAKVGGEEVEIPLSEALQGYQRQKDYTRKTQELAEKRGELEQTQEQYAQQLELLAVTLGKNLSPEQQQSLVQEYNRVVGQIHGRTREAVTETVEGEAAKLRESFGWEEEAEWEEARSNLRSYAHELGFEDEELNRVTDSRLLTVLEKARRYDAAQAEGAEVLDRSRRRSAGRTLRPGTGAGTRSRRSGREAKKAAKARERVKKTGRMDDAAKALEGII